MPAALQVTRAVPEGPPVGTLIHLEAERVTLGRKTSCHVVLRDEAISRLHARILSVDGAYYIEDLDSLGGTLVNGTASPAQRRTRLKHNDRIRICGFEAVFLDPPDSSTVEASLTPSAHTLLETQPAEKLRGLLEISASLSKTLDLDPLLPKIAESLFALFKQADRCFLIVAEEAARAGDKPRLRTRLVQTRDAKDAPLARYSTTIVERCLASAEALLFADAMQDERFEGGISVGDLHIRSGMCVPLCRGDGAAFGVIQLDTLDQGKKFKKDDLELLTGVANQASIALENARLHNEGIRQAKIEQDLAMAREVQMSFLPGEPPEVAGYEFFAYYQPARAVGGDYYGYILRQDGRLVVCVGDVAGKGMPAALLVAKLSSEMAACVPAEADPARMIEQLNGRMYPFTKPRHRFVTMALMLLDPAGHRHALVSAGHPPPLVYKPATGDLVAALATDDGGLPLGIDESCDYQALPVLLHPGETLLLFSDGVTEAPNADDEEFELAGVKAAVRGLGPATARHLVETIVRALEAHAAGCPPFDDITVVAVRRT